MTGHGPAAAAVGNAAGTGSSGTYFSAYSVVGILLLLGVAFVATAFGANRLLRPHAPSPEKLLTYECGVDPVGEGWAHTQVRYYVYAFLYAIFAVDAVYLFPWATIFAAPGFKGTTLVEMFVFLGFLAVGLLYAYKKGGPGMAVDLPVPRVGVPARASTEGTGTGAALGFLNSAAPQPMRVVLNWGRRYSLWVFNFGLACCAIEFIATSMARHDFIRLGVIPFAPGPRQADLMVVSGTVSDKMAPAVKRLYDQMPEPKYVISFGSCSNCGGPYWDSYCVTKGVDQVIPVDVYVPGCPPRPEALLQGIIKLQEKIAAEDLAARYSGRDPRNAPRLPFMRRSPKHLSKESLSAGNSSPQTAADPKTIADILATAQAQAPVSLLPPREDAPTVVLPIVEKPKPPKLFYRRYPKELRRSRDIGLNILNQKPDADDD